MDPKENWDGEPSTNGGVKQEDKSEMFTEDVVSGYATFDAYMQEAFDAIRAGIKAANNFPSGENYSYYSCFPSFNNAKKQEISRLLNVMQHVLNTVGATSKIMHRDIEEKFEVLVDANDTLLDRANMSMDEESGIARNLEPEIPGKAKRPVTNGSWNAQTYTQFSKSDSSKFVQLLNKDIAKPQTTFKDKIDNSSTPWCPRIKDKPNSIKPLAIYLVEDKDGEHFNHPYEVELDKFVPYKDQLTKRTPIQYKPLEDTPLIIIEKPEDVKILLNDLKQQKEIAIDLEHHSHRSFQGITCLMQISTPNTDYIVDALSLRAELSELNEVFTDPKVLKVFHGAESDILWLQRDLSLYIVNMFDTYQAAVQLSMPYLSLSYLLRQFCNVHPNKHLQLADWRIRPLPDTFLKYAREDVHYLLHIKDILKNKLIDLANGHSNILEAVYSRSTDICKKTYIKPICTEESYLPMYRKSKKLFNNKQLYALKELYKWRDITARENDDSTGYVLPNHMLLCIAETLPREMQGILACCNPIPPLVRQNLLALHKIILKAREQPLIKELTSDLRQRLAQRNQAADSDAYSYCPHDIPSGAEPRANLPCLLDESYIQENISSDGTVRHKVTVFDSPPASEDEETSEVKQTSAQKNMLTFVSPFERYKRVIPMVAEHEARERERQRQEEEERLNKIKKEEEETKSSISRVHEHFQQISQAAVGKSQKTDRKVERENSSKQPLSKMPGRKRKKNSNVIKEEELEGRSNDSLSTPVPVLNKKIVPGMKRKAEDAEEQNVQRSHREAQARIGDGEIKPMRKRMKGEKKKNEKELAKKAMLPSEHFDYKSVDFSSFQGGSINAPNQVRFEHDARKKKKMRRGKKTKTKVNI